MASVLKEKFCDLYMYLYLYLCICFLLKNSGGCSDKREMCLYCICHVCVFVIVFVLVKDWGGCCVKRGMCSSCISHVFVLVLYFYLYLLYLLRIGAGAVLKEKWQN